MGILELKNIITRIKELIGQGIMERAQKRISEMENRTIENIQSGKKGKK